MKLLLVEDDPGIARFALRGLAAEGYVVDWHRDGRNAAASLATGSYCAAILDLGLPDCDGLDLCRDLRAAGIDTPVIMLTARTTLQDRLDGFDCGADDYLPKPFAFAELVARLAAMIRRSGMRPGRIAFGTLRLDQIAREAFVGTVRLTLSRRAFDVLAALVQGGGPVARETLLKSVWGSDTEVSDNSVDVYIGTLRRVLAAHPDAPTIRTLRGQGFQLVLKNETI
ncbi:response regulator transcription factor [Glacieibacterium sp.]|uniref:response regulator transcription factor n=1 Tax=Glacieibacterium sp. TaxID=2860237 RepID=UPI003B00FD6D